jgi:hypothetical protein
MWPHWPMTTAGCSTPRRPRPGSRPATHLGWARDPLDRLLAAHVQFRGWRLAAGDRALLEHLGTGHGFAL